MTLAIPPGDGTGHVALNEFPSYTARFRHGGFGLVDFTQADVVRGEKNVLDRSQMQIDDRLVNLSPGMAVTVEIKTGSRRILSYLLSPLLRYQHETLRER